jgi:hypothetical protein
MISNDRADHPTEITYTNNDSQPDGPGESPSHFVQISRYLELHIR